MKLLRIILIAPILFSCDFITKQKLSENTDAKQIAEQAAKWSFLKDVERWDEDVLDSALNLIAIPQFQRAEVNDYLEQYREQAKDYVLAIQSDSVDYIIEVEEDWSKMGNSVDSLKNYIDPSETEKFTQVMDDISRILKVGSDQ